MLVGQQFGPFTIDKELGSGAMGTVYRGRFTKTGQVMAIKVMAPGVGSTNAAAADRFEREITILKQLNHPNIVRFYGAGKQHGSRYFAMEYVEGESLDKVMSRRGRMTWEEVVELGRQLCAALQHSHEKGIIHRDLKPSNIMVLPDGTLKLTDFGIAKDTDLEALTATNCTVGTASYMSPEQCKGERVLTHKSDLYSLGVLFYELLTGDKPFKADNAMEMFLQHVQGTFERPSRRVLDIPVWLDTLVCQLMEKKPEQRPLDASMVATTLGSIQEKVEAQQSAGVDAVRRRMIDRTSGHKKRTDEEDKEAAHLLLTGKARPKRKLAKKGLHQKVWFQATGLLLALGVVGFLLYLAFRPPSADKLYQQAKRVMQSGDVEKQEAAIGPDGPIGKYLHHYRDRKDAQAQEVRAWNNQIEVEQNERLLEDFMRRERNKKFNRLPESKTQEDAFKAVKAEDEGDRARATELWQPIEKDASPSWQRVAANHLADLGSLDQIDKEFQRLHDQIEEAGEEKMLPDPHQQKAFLAWRAENIKLQEKLLKDTRQARSLLMALKAETTGVSGPARRWFLYAAANARRLDQAGKDRKEDKKEDVVEKGGRLVQEARELLDSQPPKIRRKEALLLCLDLLALYENDEEMETLVRDARKLRDDIVSGKIGK